MKLIPVSNQLKKETSAQHILGLLCWMNEKYARKQSFPPFAFYFFLSRYMHKKHASSNFQINGK